MGAGAAVRGCSILGFALCRGCVARTDGTRTARWTAGGAVGRSGAGAFCLNTFNRSAVLFGLAIVSVVYGVSIVYVHYTSIRKRHQGNRELQNFFTGGRGERRPSLADRVLIALPVAQVDRDNRGADLFRALVHQAAEDRVLLDLIEEHADGGLRSLGLHEPDGLFGFPDICRGRGGDDERNVRRPNRRGGRRMLQVRWGIEEENVVRRVRLRAFAVDETERLIACALGIPVLDRDGFSGLLERLMEKQAHSAFPDAPFLRE